MNLISVILKAFLCRIWRSGFFFSVSFLKSKSRSDQKGCRQNEIKGDFRVQDHWLFKTTRGSFLYHEFLYGRSGVNCIARFNLTGQFEISRTIAEHFTTISHCKIIYKLDYNLKDYNAIFRPSFLCWIDPIELGSLLRWRHR